MKFNGLLGPFFDKKPEKQPDETPVKLTESELGELVFFMEERGLIALDAIKATPQ